MRLLLFIVFCTSVLTASSITVIHPDNYVPYSSVDSTGKSIGILVDWWRLWEKHSGTKVEFKTCNTMTDAIDSVKKQKADVIAGLFSTAERMDDLSYEDPILRTEVSILSKRGSTIRQLSDLQDSTWVVRGDFAETFIEGNYPRAPLKRVDSYGELQEAVAKQIPRAFVADIPSLRARPVSAYPKGYTLFLVIKEEKLRPAVRKGNDKLLFDIREGADKIPAAELRTMAVSWNLLPPSRRPLIISITSVLIIAVILLLLALIKIKKEERRIHDYETRDWKMIIGKGESDTIEFKSSLRYDYRQQCTNKKLEQVIVKTISALLNSEGGLLFIGVDDDGNILGLENDYTSLQKKNADGFILALTNTVNINLGKKCHHFITMHMVTMNDKEICIVSVEKSDTPVFFGKGEKEEFYIRASASSQPLGLRETHEYINTHWKK